MQDRSKSLVPAVILLASAIGLAVFMLIAVGLAEALALLAVVTVLSGAYGLRQYARARLIYRRPAESPDKLPAEGRH